MHSQINVAWTELESYVAFNLKKKKLLLLEINKLNILTSC